MLFACNGNNKDVVISGVLLDYTTGAPVIGAVVNVKCWVYDTQLWESRAIEKEVTTDTEGKFSTFFEEGEAFDVKIDAVGYKSHEQSRTLRKRKADLIFELAME